jgi:hypothetical protein
MLASLHDGTQEVDVVVEFIVEDCSDSTPREIGRFRIPLRAQFDLVPPNVPTVNLKTPPELRASVPSWFDVSTVYLDDNCGARFRIAHQCPVIVGADVFLRNNGREWAVGSILTDHDLSPTELNWTPVPGFSADRADIILRPNIKRAEQTVDVTEIWGEEIILKDVPVTRPIPTTQPTDTNNAVRT